MSPEVTLPGSHAPSMALLPARTHTAATGSLQLWSMLGPAVVVDEPLSVLGVPLHLSWLAVRLWRRTEDSAWAQSLCLPLLTAFSRQAPVQPKAPAHPCGILIALDMTHLSTPNNPARDLHPHKP